MDKRLVSSSFADSYQADQKISPMSLVQEHVMMHMQACMGLHDKANAAYGMAGIGFSPVSAKPPVLA